MAVISTLAVNIIAKTAGFTQGVRGTRKTMMAFNSTMQSTKRLLTGLIAGTGIVRGFRSIIRVASEAQETMAKFNTVFRDMGNARGVEKWADTFANAVGRAKQDVKSYLAELQDIFVPLGFARNEAAKFAKSLTQLGVDVASFNEKVDRDVMRNFTSALMGSHRATRQYGIAISESRIQQESWLSGINKSFARLTDMEKIYLRYRIILNDTKDAQGDATRTQDDFANQLKRTKGRIKDLANEIGSKLLPHLVGVLRVVRNVIDHFSALSAASVGVSLANVRLAASIAVFLYIFPKIVSAVYRLIKALHALTKAQTIAKAFGGPAGWASLAAGAAIAGVAVVALNKQFDKLAGTVNKLSKEKGEFKSIGEQIKVTMDDIRQSLERSQGPQKAPIIETIKTLRKELTKLSLSADGLVRFNLEEELGMSRFSARGKGVFEALDIMLRIRGLLTDKALGVTIFEEAMTPAEKFADKLRELGRLLARGAITPALFDRAAMQAKADASGGGKSGAGTFEVIRKSLVSITGLADAQSPTLTKMDKQIAEAKKTNLTLANIDKLIASQREVLSNIPLTTEDFGAVKKAIEEKMPETKRDPLTAAQRLARLDFVENANRVRIQDRMGGKVARESFKHLGNRIKDVLGIGDKWVGGPSTYVPEKLGGRFGQQRQDLRFQIEAEAKAAKAVKATGFSPPGLGSAGGSQDLQAWYSDLVAETKKSNAILERIAAKESLN